MQTSHFILAAALLLTACGKAPEQAAHSGNATTPNGSTGHDPSPASAENSASSASAGPNGSSASTDHDGSSASADHDFSPERAANGTDALPPAKRAIPAAFQGRWGMVPGDCGPDASIAKGLMVIDGAQLRFYESVGKPAVVTNPTPNRMEGRFTFTGEGMEWSKDMVLTLGGNDDRLVRSENNPKASYSYKRCPA